MSITIILPLPPNTLSPNARVHWAAKGKAVAKYRRDAEYAAIAALAAMAFDAGLRMERPRWKRATATVAFYFRTRRRRDGDNALASIKAGLDGIADAGIVVNDSGLFPLLFEDWHRVDPNNPRVEIVVKEMPPEEEAVAHG